MSEKAIHQENDVPKVKTGDENTEKPNSPNYSEKTISDDDEIDYSIKPEFYSPNLDSKDELWVQKRRKGHYSDAVLSCPACFTTVCLECQRLMGVKVWKPKRKRARRGKASPAGETTNAVTGETFKGVLCSVCSTEVGVIDDEEIYHFFNVLPSEC